MSLTELQDAILVRLIGKLEEAEIVCTYPAWLERRMVEHKVYVAAHFERRTVSRTRAMKQLTHAQFYAEAKGKREQESERHQRVSAQAAGR